MLEYGIKNITTNPTLITKSKEIIKLIDSRTKEVRAYVFPTSYAKMVEKFIKELEYREWVKEKKRELKKVTNDNDKLDDFMEAGIDSINEYIGKEDEKR